MSNTNRNMAGRHLEFEMDQLNRIRCEMKESLTKKKHFNDRMEAGLNDCWLKIRKANELCTKATNFHNELIDGYEIVQSNLKAGLQEERDKAEKNQESKMWDEEIAKLECEKMQLTAKLEQFDLNAAKSRKELEDIRTHNKKLEKEMDTLTNASSVADKNKESQKGKNIPTQDINHSQNNSTQSDERLMNIHGIEQAAFLDRYFEDAAKIKQEPVTD